MDFWESPISEHFFFFFYSVQVFTFTTCLIAEDKIAEPQVVQHFPSYQIHKFRIKISVLSPAA